MEQKRGRKSNNYCSNNSWKSDNNREINTEKKSYKAMQNKKIKESKSDKHMGTKKKNNNLIAHQNILYFGCKKYYFRQLQGKYAFKSIHDMISKI